MEDDPEIVNIALLGSDTTQGGGIGRTDVMILVSVNKREGTAAMWHLPRDLFVYIPNHTMDRINLAFAYGARSTYDGTGWDLFKETVLYNFGIELDFYARVNFDDFMTIVEKLGGVNISVDCAITDWRLIDPELDPTLEENWEYYTLPIGRQTLEPYMALWYARSRVTTSDLDRGRRQMDLLRAMWYQAREQNLFSQVTELWPEAVETVDTNMTLSDVLGFVPLAASLDISSIARYSGSVGVHYISMKTPDDGRMVFLPNREALIPLIQNFLTPATSNRLSRQATTIEVVDASHWGIGFDQVAADRLAWEGFTAIRGGRSDGVARNLTVLYDYTGQSKGSVLEDLQRVLRVSPDQVIVQPDPNRTVDFRVENGRAYNSCVIGGEEENFEQGPPVAEAAENTP
jgi:LCP family protein required for cell wall assembly